MFPVLFQKTPYSFHPRYPLPLVFHAENIAFKAVKLVVVKAFNPF
jgi:hypothetical protein